MLKIDLKKELMPLYNASAKEATIVDVPRMHFLMIDGRGNPNTAKKYLEAVEALYALAYAIKFKIKRDTPPTDYAVMPLEGLWWVEDPADLKKKDRWYWTMMILQPRAVADKQVQEAIREVEQKKNPPALPSVRFEPFIEGMSAQILHVGPYSAEEKTVARLHQFILDRGYRLGGKHHEIYLNDPRKTVLAKLKTILRQPFVKASPPNHPE